MGHLLNRLKEYKTITSYKVLALPAIQGRRSQRNTKGYVTEIVMSQVAFLRSKSQQPKSARYHQRRTQKQECHQQTTKEEKTQVHPTKRKTRHVHVKHSNLHLRTQNINQYEEASMEIWREKQPPNASHLYQPL